MDKLKIVVESDELNDTLYYEYSVSGRGETNFIGLEQS